MKTKPTLPGTRVVVTDYAYGSSRRDLFHLFSLVAPIDYIGFSGVETKRHFCFLDFADEADAMTACALHNFTYGEKKGKTTMWVKRVANHVPPGEFTEEFDRGGSVVVSP